MSEDKRADAFGLGLYVLQILRKGSFLDFEAEVDKQPVDDYFIGQEDVEFKEKPWDGSFDLPKRPDRLEISANYDLFEQPKPSSDDAVDATAPRSEPNVDKDADPLPREVYLVDNLPEQPADEENSWLTDLLYPLDEDGLEEKLSFLDFTLDGIPSDSPDYFYFSGLRHFFGEIEFYEGEFLDLERSVKEVTIAFFTSAVDKNGNYTRALVSRALLLHDIGNYTEAIADIDEVIRQSSEESPELYSLLGTFFWDRYKSQEEETRINHIEDLNNAFYYGSEQLELNVVQELSDLGEALEDAERYDDAYEAYHAARELAEADFALFRFQQGDLERKLIAVTYLIEQDD